MNTPTERPADLHDMHRAWPDKADDELRAAADAIAAAGGTLTVTTAPAAEILPETCDECESTGYNCALHSGPEWTGEDDTP